MLRLPLVQGENALMERRRVDMDLPSMNGRSRKRLGSPAAPEALSEFYAPPLLFSSDRRF